VLTTLCSYISANKCLQILINSYTIQGSKNTAVHTDCKVGINPYTTKYIADCFIWLVNYGISAAGPVYITIITNISSKKKKVHAEAKAYFVTVQTSSLYVSIVIAVLLRFSEQLITKPQDSVDLYVTFVG
jgi:hypothetical protein